MDIICNGFSIKEAIFDVLNKYSGCTLSTYEKDDAYIGKLCEEIKEVFAVKLRLKQGGGCDEV